MGVHEVKFRFTGGVDGGRGWRLRFNSEEAVRLSCRELLRSVYKKS